MSFVRKTAGKRNVSVAAAGTISSINQLQLTSSGIESFDNVCGGGLPVSGMVIMQEDMFTCYHGLLSRYYLSEGIAHGHTILSISGNSEGAFKESLLSLPRNTTISGHAQPASSAVNHSVDAVQEHSSLSIAWQYEKYLNPCTKFENSSASDSWSRDSDDTRRVSFRTFCHEYDLSSTIDVQLIAQSRLQIHHIDVSATIQSSHTTLEAVEVVLTQVALFLQERSVLTSNFPLTRVVVHSLFPDVFRSQSHDADLAAYTRLISGLRSIVRNSFAILWVGVPAWILDASPRMRGLADLFFELSSFVGDGALDSDGRSEFGDFDGILRVNRAPAMNSFSNIAFCVNSPNFLFKVKRKEIIIERISLPPDEFTPSGLNACGSHGGSHSLDF